MRAGLPSTDGIVVVIRVRRSEEPEGGLDVEVTGGRRPTSVVPDKSVR